MPKAFLLQRGLTSYWGYNTIGYFALTSGTRPRCGPGGEAGPVGDPDVLALRARQSRPILTSLLLPFGIPSGAANPYLAPLG